MVFTERPNLDNGSSVESGFEPGTLRPQSRDLTTWPPRSVNFAAIIITLERGRKTRKGTRKCKVNREISRLEEFSERRRGKEQAMTRQMSSSVGSSVVHQSACGFLKVVF
ncbi:hypothetical protein AVEN_213711-1 [Araneus ventricosus]|uniref:Uncharacterized protein n=1 Tax=Araneus ventricosus TaxID=182803 RepID=A0A4Y2GN96_ARAVE|nr:hypothetical protein AVEN_213711-1 [Araneus ventricosus]